MDRWILSRLKFKLDNMAKTEAMKHIVKNDMLPDFE